MEYWYTWQRESKSNEIPFISFGASTSYPDGEFFNLTKELYAKRIKRKEEKRKSVSAECHTKSLKM